MSTATAAPAAPVERYGPFLLFPRTTRPLHRPDLLGNLRVARVEPAHERCTDLVRKELALIGLANELLGGWQPIFWAGLEPALRGLFRSRGLKLSVASAPTTENATTSGTAAGSTTADPVTGTSANGAAGTDASGPVARAPAITDEGAVPPMIDPAVVTFAAGVSRGLVRYGSSVDVFLLIATVCVAFAGKKVVVLVRKRADGRQLCALLREFGVDAALVTGKHYSLPRGVTVCTLGAAGRAGIEGADVILVADALHSTWTDPLTEPPIPHEVFLRRYPSKSTGRDPRTPLAVGLMDRLQSAPTAAIVIGFMPSGRTLSPFEQARVWQLYGFAELVVPRHGIVERPVTTAVTDKVNLRKAIPVGGDEVAVKKALRHDPLRNRLRAKLARSLREGNRNLLMTFSPIPAAPAAATPKAVLLLCEGLDQAQAVRKFVRDWPLVTGLDDPAHDLEAALTDPTGGVVATALGAEKLPGDMFDVVVRCDPGRGLPPLPRGWLETHEPNPRPLVVADVDDRGHRLPALWTRMRKRAYLKAGWARANFDSDETAWARFEALVLDREERP